MEPRHSPRIDRSLAFGRSVFLWTIGALALGHTATTPLVASDASDPSVALFATAEGIQIASSDGARTEVALEAGARFDHAVALDDGWIAAGVRDGGALLLLRTHRATGEEPERMSVPAAGGALVATPAPIVADGKLVGMTWLAGDAPRRLAVRYAEWLDDGWGPYETVAAPEPGSQLAASGVALPDGSVMVVWSAFDGEDDEILWSLRSGGSWSPAARIAADNAVPDITPAVAFEDGQPLAVWSRFDGTSYSVVLSRFEAGAWSEPTAIAPTGSLFPSFRSSAEGPLVVYRDVPAGGWTVVRLDRQFRPAARATIETENGAEPLVLDAGPETLRVVPGPGREAVTLRWDR